MQNSYSMKSNVRAWIEKAVIVFVLGYGLHYLAYFLRARYFSWLGGLGLGEGVVHPEIAEPDHLRRRVAVRIQNDHILVFQSISVPHSSVQASRSRLHSR